MGHFFRNRWFLISLVALIATGLFSGRSLSSESIQRLDQFVEAYQVPRLTTAIVLFLMAFSLDTRQLTDAFRSPGPVIWGSIVNFGFIPLAAWPLMKLQGTLDFAIGLMIVASVPCTLAGASVWTRRAKGNDAVSLMVTLTTNGLCFLITPFWLQLATSQKVALSSSDLILRLFIAVIVPTMIGQLARQQRHLGRFAAQHKLAIGVIGQVMILVIVLLASIEAGTKLNSDASGVTAWDVSVVWITCIVLHLAAMLVSGVGGRALRFRRADRIALLFAGSQKTLPIGLLLATDPAMFGSADAGVPFAVFPILMYHASQLFVDTLVADRVAINGATDAAEEAIAAVD